jgi:hypothetical protein
MIAEGEIVTCRWVSSGTHRGPLSGVAPTGKNITVSGITINRLVEGKIVEGWVNWDALGMLQQLEVIPVLFKAKGAANQEPGLHCGNATHRPIINRRDGRFHLRPCKGPRCLLSKSE